MECLEVTALPQEGIHLPRRKAIVVTARALPEDTDTSSLFQGFLEALQGPGPLRSLFVFYLLPVVNPDGVLAGLSDHTLTGKQPLAPANQRWNPEATALSSLLRKVRAERDLAFHLDFCCNPLSNSAYLSSSGGCTHPPLRVLLLARILGQLNCSLF